MNSHNLDNAATFALNAMPEEEALAFEQELDSTLADEVASFERVAVALTNGLPDIAPAAPPALWDRIATEAGISEEPESEQATPRSFRWLMLAAAAVVVVVAMGATTLLATQTTTSDTRSLAAAAATSTEAFTATLASPDGDVGIEPEVVISADGTGYLIADSLPRLDDDRTYQLWLIVDDRVISAALLGNDPEVVQFRAEGNINGIAISNEVAGGVVVSEVAPTAIWLNDSV